MGRLFRVLLVLALVAVGADFAVRLIIEDRVESALERRGYLDASAFNVEAAGFPFIWHLTQGTFPQIVVTAQDVEADRADLESVRLDLRDVDWSFPDERGAPDVLVVAQEGDGVVTLSSESLSALVPESYGLRLDLLQDEVRITPDAEGQTTTVAEDDLSIEADDAAGSLRIDAPSPVGPILVPLPDLVDGAKMRDANIERRELTISFTVRDVELGLPSPQS